MSSHHDIADSDSPLDPMDALISTLFEEHYQGLCSFTFRFVRDRDVAEEIVQELFLRVWERLEAGAPVGQITAAYLYGSARNLAINLSRRQQLEKHRLSASVHQLARTSPSADANSDREELSTLIQRAAEKLPQRSRLVLTLSRDRNMTYSEIAAVLGISIKGVEFHMSRALKALREAID